METEILMKIGTITFPNYSCVVLWNNELIGQMSDGMWENINPDDHWKFWHDLDVQVGTDCRVITDQSYKCKKIGYNFARLYEIIGERMLAIGRMGRVTTDENVCRAAKDMSLTLEEFLSNKLHGTWKYEYVAKYMESVSEELAREFYNTKYTMQDLRRDIASIKAAMKTVKR